VDAVCRPVISKVRSCLPCSCCNFRDLFVTCQPCTRWMLLCRRAVRARRDNMAQERRLHVLRAALWTWKACCLGVFAPVDARCNTSGQAASTAVPSAFRQGPASGNGAVTATCAVVAKLPKARAWPGGIERGADSKDHGASSVANSAAVHCTSSSDASGTPCCWINGGSFTMHEHARVYCKRAGAREKDA